MEGKLILDGTVCYIRFEQLPTLANPLNLDKEDWLPFKFQMVKTYNYSLCNSRYRTIYLIVNDNAIIYKLVNSFFNLECNEITFTYLTKFD